MTLAVKVALNPNATNQPNKLRLQRGLPLSFYAVNDVPLITQNKKY